MKGIEAISYTMFRVVAGAMFALHGVQKLFPDVFPSPNTPEDYVRFIAGPIEMVGGAMIVLGLFTRYAAFVSSGLMAVAYWQVHGLREGLYLPIQNGGETAVLYCFVFFFIFAKGGGAISVDVQRERSAAAKSK